MTDHRDRRPRHLVEPVEHPIGQRSRRPGEARQRIDRSPCRPGSPGRPPGPGPSPASSSTRPPDRAATTLSGSSPVPRPAVSLASGSSSNGTFCFAVAVSGFAVGGGGFATSRSAARWPSYRSRPRRGRSARRVTPTYVGSGSTVIVAVRRHRVRRLAVHDHRGLRLLRLRVEQPARCSAPAGPQGHRRCRSTSTATGTCRCRTPYCGVVRRVGLHLRDPHGQRRTCRSRRCCRPPGS